MAVVSVKATVVSNADATPSIINTAQLASGRVREKRGAVLVTNGDSIGSTYRMFRVNSNDLVSRLLLSCNAITTCAADFGLYKTVRDGGAVAHASLFASAQSIATGVSNSDITKESGAVAPADMEKCVWQTLGLTEDPQIKYDVTMTLTAAAASTGSVALIMSVVGRN